MPVGVSAGGGPVPGNIAKIHTIEPGTIMQSACRDGLPNDVLIVEDDPLIALDFEDTIRGFGVETVRCSIECIALQAVD